MDFEYFYVFGAFWNFIVTTICFQCIKKSGSEILQNILMCMSLSVIRVLNGMVK